MATYSPSNGSRPVLAALPPPAPHGTNEYKAAWFAAQQDRLIQALDGNQDAYQSIVTDRTPLQALFVLRQREPQSQNLNNASSSSPSSSYTTTHVVLLYLMEDIIVRRQPERPLEWSHLRDAWVNLLLPASPWHFVLDHSIMFPPSKEIPVEEGHELWKLEERVHRALRLHDPQSTMVGQGNHKRRKLMASAGPTATQDAVRATILVWLAYLEDEDNAALGMTGCHAHIIECVQRWGLYTAGWTYKLSETLQLAHWITALTSTMLFHLQPGVIQDLLLFRPTESLWDFWTRVTGINSPASIAIWSELVGHAYEVSDNDANEGMWQDILRVVMQWFDPMSQWSLEQGRQRPGAVFANNSATHVVPRDDHFDEHTELLEIVDLAHLLTHLDRVRVPEYATFVHGGLSLKRHHWQKCLDLAGRLEQRQVMSQPAAFALYRKLFDHFAETKLLLDWPLGSRSAHTTWTTQFQWRAGPLGHECFEDSFEEMAEKARGSLLRDICLFAVARMRQSQPWSAALMSPSARQQQQQRFELTREQRSAMDDRAKQICETPDTTQSLLVEETVVQPMVLQDENVRSEEESIPEAEVASEEEVEAAVADNEDLRSAAVVPVYKSMLEANAESAEEFDSAEDEKNIPSAGVPPADDEIVEVESSSDEEENDNSSSAPEEEDSGDEDDDQPDNKKQRMSGEEEPDFNAHEENEFAGRSSDDSDPKAMVLNEEHSYNDVAESGEEYTEDDNSGEYESQRHNDDNPIEIQSSDTDEESDRPDEDATADDNGDGDEARRLNSDASEVQDSGAEERQADLESDASEAPREESRSNAPEPRATDENYYATEEESQEEDEVAPPATPQTPAQGIAVESDTQVEQRHVRIDTRSAPAAAVEDEGYLPEGDHTADEMLPPPRRAARATSERDGYQGGESSIGHTEEDEEISEAADEEDDDTNLPDEGISHGPAISVPPVLDNHSLSGMSAADERGGPEEVSSELEEANESDQVHFPPTNALPSNVQEGARSLVDFALASQAQQDGNMSSPQAHNLLSSDTTHPLSNDDNEETATTEHATEAATGHVAADLQPDGGEDSHAEEEGTVVGDEVEELEESQPMAEDIDREVVSKVDAVSEIVEENSQGTEETTQVPTSSPNDIQDVDVQKSFAEDGEEQDDVNADPQIGAATSMAEPQETADANQTISADILPPIPEDQVVTAVGTVTIPVANLKSAEEPESPSTESAAVEAESNMDKKPASTSRPPRPPRNDTRSNAKEETKDDEASMGSRSNASNSVAKDDVSTSSRRSKRIAARKGASPSVEEDEQSTSSRPSTRSAAKATSPQKSVMSTPSRRPTRSGTKTAPPKTDDDKSTASRRSTRSSTKAASPQKSVMTTPSRHSNRLAAKKANPPHEDDDVSVLSSASEMSTQVEKKPKGRSKKAAASPASGRAMSVASTSSRSTRRRTRATSETPDTASTAAVSKPSTRSSSRAVAAKSAAQDDTEDASSKTSSKATTTQKKRGRAKKTKKEDEEEDVAPPVAAPPTLHDADEAEEPEPPSTRSGGRKRKAAPTKKNPPPPSTRTLRSRKR